MTRNRLLELNKGEYLINVPVIAASSSKKASRVYIDNSFDWRGKIKIFLELNYKRRPFFEQMHPHICRIIDTPADSLHEYNSLTIKSVCTMLQVGTLIQFENEKYLDLENEIRGKQNGYYTNFIQPPDSIQPMTARILALCRDLGTDCYINAIGGKDLYSTADFNNYNIKLRFLRAKDYQYPQTIPDFIPHLSIIDVLYSLGIDGTINLLTNYDLIY